MLSSALLFNFHKQVQTIAFLACLKYHNNPKLKEIKQITKDDDHNDVINLEEDDVIDLEDDDGSVIVDSSTESTYFGGKQRNRPHIIIVPSSVLSNWQREFTKFCPDMVVVK